MPNEVTAQPVESPAPAAPTPATPVTPAAPADRHPGLSSLLGALMDEIPDEPEKKPKPEKKPEVVADKPATPAAPAPADRPIKARKAPAPQRPALPVDESISDIEKQQNEELARSRIPVNAQDRKAWRESLLDNEREMLAEAEYAEKKFPDRHRGLSAKTEKFLRDHAELVERPDFDDQSDTYRQFLEKNRPVLAERDIRDITTARTADKVHEEVRPEITELRQELFKREVEPEIENKGRQIFQRLANESLPDEMTKAFKDAGGGMKGVEALKAEFPMEFEIADNVVAMATEDLKEFMRIGRVNPRTGMPLSTVARDQNDPRWAQHQRLGKMVTELCDGFKTTGGAELQRDGKWFVTRDEWNSLPQGKRGQFWTFTNEELMDRGQRHVKHAVAAVIKHERDAMERRGFVRRARPAAPAPAPATPPGPSAPTPSPRPSAAPSSSSAPAAPDTGMGGRLAGLLNQG